MKMTPFERQVYTAVFAAELSAKTLAQRNGNGVAVAAAIAANVVQTLRVYGQMVVDGASFNESVITDGVRELLADVLGVSAPKRRV